MEKILFGLMATVASLMLVDSLMCNKCTYGFQGYCLSLSEETCGSNTSVCFTGKLSFTQLSSVGINSQGCREPTDCNGTMNGTLASYFDYQYKIDCCETDKCNPVQTSAASSNTVTLPAAVAAAVLASVWGSLM